MSLLSKKDFAAVCQTTVAVLDTNISRGKVVYIRDLKKMDTEDPLNAAFKTRYLTVKKTRDDERARVKNVEKMYTEVVEKATEIASKKINEAVVTEKVKQSSARSRKIVDWDARKKKADTLLVERRAEKEQLTLEKLAGKLIPLDLMFEVLRAHNQNIFATFQNDVENLGSIYCDILAGGDRGKLSEITTKLSEKLADIINRSKDVAISGIESAVEDYQDTRSRGEHK